MLFYVGGGGGEEGTWPYGLSLASRKESHDIFPYLSESF